MAESASASNETVSRSHAGGDRLAAILERLAGELARLIEDFAITDDELVRATDFLGAVAAADEMFLLAEAMGLSTAADNVTHEFANRGGTASNIEGPFYRHGSPRLHAPYVLRGGSERGADLLFRGRVADARTSEPIAGADVDVWQADAEGVYDIQRDPSGSLTYLRGILSTDDEGAFEVRTEMPGAYEIPKAGPVGTLLARAGHTAFRPAHIHFRISAPGYATMTTQIYFEGDKWIDRDVLGAVKPTLITAVHDMDHTSADSEDVRVKKWTDYDFVLVQINEEHFA